MDRTLFGLEARREAREAVRHPGKFEGESPMTVILYNVSLDGWTDLDDTLGDDWVALMGRYIIIESNDGFVSSMRYKDRLASDDAFASMVAEYSYSEE